MSQSTGFEGLYGTDALSNANVQAAKKLPLKKARLSHCF